MLVLTGAQPSQDRIAPCLAELQRAPKALGPYQCLIAAAAQGQPRAVMHLLQRMVRLHPDDPRPRLYLALLKDFSGEPVAETEFAMAVEGFRREGEPFGRVYSLTSLVGSRCFAHLSCDAAAQGFLTEAERVAEESDSNHLRRLVQLFWLRVSLLTDDVARAERAASRLDAIAGDDPPWLSGQVFEARARLAYQTKNFNREAAIYSEMLKMSASGAEGRAIALGGLGEAMAHLALRGREDRAAAEEVLRRALDEERRLDLHMTVGGNGTLRTTEVLALLLGPTEESTRLLEQNLALYTQRAGWSGQRAFSTEWILARNLVDSPTARAAEALEVADRSAQRASEAHLLWEHAHAILVRAYVLWKSGRPKEASLAADTALRELEQLRSKQEDIEVRIRYEDTLAFAYELVAGLVLDPRFGEIREGDVEYAFSVTERMRARALLEDVLARDRAKRLSRRDETPLRARILSSQELLLDPLSVPSARSAAVVELRAAESQLVELRTSGVGLQMQEDVSPSLKAIQVELSPREALVSFQEWSPDARTDAPFVDGRSWATIVTQSAISVLPIPNADQLDVRVNFFRRVLGRRDGSEAPGSVVLYEALMKQVVHALPPEVDQLVLIPDGPLHQLPFDALRMAPSGPFLAQRFSLTLVPSAAIWLALRTRPLAPGGLALALVLANPDLASAAAREANARGESLEALTEANQEGERAVQAFPSGSRLISGASASKGSLLSMDLAPFTLVHFATHSLVDPVAPERSAIVLASASAADDGLLRVADISTLGLAGKTVVLASCSTSEGLIRRSEGLMSLSRPFLAAGAQAVVGALQSVRDAESSRFFDDFYSALEAGKSMGDSLWAAKRARIAAQAPPAAWSGFVLLGNGKAAPRAADTSHVRAVAGLVCAAGVLVAVGFRRRWARTRARTAGARGP
jgi:CHAT domain-containing protein